jgi:hypothetical protein
MMLSEEKFLKENQPGVNQNLINLSMQNFHDGVYILEIISQNESHTIKYKLQSIIKN